MPVPGRKALQCMVWAEGTAVPGFGRRVRSSWSTRRVLQCVIRGGGCVVPGPGRRALQCPGRGGDEWEKATPR